MEALGALSFIIFMLAAIYLVAQWNAQASRQSFAEVAARYGLEMHEKKILGFSEPSFAVGNWQGRQLRFWVYYTAAGKSRKTWSAVGLRPQKTGGLAFELRGRSIFSWLHKPIGLKRVNFGEFDLDKSWCGWSNHPEFLAAALTPEIRVKLAAVPVELRGEGFHLVDGWVCCAEPDVFWDRSAVARLESQLSLLFDLAILPEVFAESVARK